MQLMGAVHGGVLASLVDTVTYWSVYYGIEDEKAWLTTVDLKVNYLAPVDRGRLIARGRQIKIGNHEKIIIHNYSSSTLFILDGIKITGDFKFPAKFLV